MNVQEIYHALDAFAPFSLAMEWDNSGLLIGNDEDTVTGVLITLDADFTALKAAFAAGCNTIISHHPFFFESEKRITDDTPFGRKVRFAVQNGLNILSAHTNLDACPGGINDTLGQLLELRATGGFCPTPNGGMLGRLGRHSFENRTAFLTHAERILNTHARFCFVNDRFDNLAWVSGSGASCMEQALQAGADTLITGDVKYSAYMEARELGINLIDLGHFETEQIILPVLQKKLPDVKSVLNIVNSPIEQI